MENEGAITSEQRILTIANDVLKSAGLPGVPAFTLTAPCPRLDSPLPLAEIAAAFQLAVAHATAVVATEAGASPPATQADRYEVSPAQALAGLEPTHFQRIHRHRFPQSSHSRELKSDFYATADGHWFLTSGSYPHLRDGTLALLNCANTKSAIAAAISRYSADELEATAAERGLPGAYVRTPESWLSSEAGRATAASPLLMQRALRPGAAVRADLASQRVLDLSHVIAGPIIARHFALCGGDVLRVSSPAQPDPLPQILDTGIGKRNAFADLHEPGDLAHVQALAEQADVIVDSWRPGALAQFGLDADDIARRGGRDFIYVAVSAFGPAGPWATRKAFDQVVQAATGIAALHEKDGKPSLSPTRLLTDYLTGQLGIVGVLGALRQRQRHGGSWTVQVSLARVATYLLAWADPAHRGDDKFDALEPRMITYQGAFGATHHVAPAVNSLGMKTGEICGSQPLGSSPATWRSP
ncbi:CoA transferase [Bordetella sp. 02P26C-1]|uniref:CoA transferase n=1 Tax=Bordetella sp. 02P26C-1 TaxID=2683195 RepID=UPI0013544CC7|nr:CoA transferase [Bordetella sp. 02P26C-1]MVW80512.1 hypothetical protein [Bordetella sp. 02P26C-1]